MQNKRIIYPNSDGGVAVIIPALDCELPLEQIALKDVPRGVPYKIIDVADMPSDKTFREAWEVDIDDPDGHGADYGEGSCNRVIGWTKDNLPFIELRDEEGKVLGVGVVVNEACATCEGEGQ